MDAFGDNFGDSNDIDPAAEFLAREQDQLAGLEDEIPPVSMSTGAATVPTVEGSTIALSSMGCLSALIGLSPFTDDLSGAFGNMKTTGGGGGDSEGSFEMINTIGQPAEPSQPAAGETTDDVNCIILWFVAEFWCIQCIAESTPAVNQVREEPEKIRKWREEQMARLEQKGNSQTHTPSLQGVGSIVYLIPSVNTHSLILIG